MPVVHLQKVKIGRWIDLAQGPVQIEGSDLGSEVEALRVHDLEDVARGNILLTALHIAQVNIASRASMNLKFACLGLRRLPPECRAQSCRELSLEGSNVTKCAVVGAARILARNIRRRHDVNLVA